MQKVFLNLIYIWHGVTFCDPSKFNTMVAGYFFKSNKPIMIMSRFNGTRKYDTFLGPIHVAIILLLM